MDYIKNNLRVIIIGLLAVGIVVAIASSGDSKPKEATKETATAQDETDTEETEVETEVAPDEPVAASDGVQKSEEGFSVTAASGDSQTKMVRKVIAAYLADANATLSPEQTLFAETNLVNSLKKSDLIYAGTTIQLTNKVVEELVTAAGNLSERQLQAWAKYL